MKTAFPLLLAIFLSSGSAFAWSSPASHTHSRLEQLDLAIQSYQMDNGRLPSPATWEEDLQKAGYVESLPLQDAWKQPFLYRVPGAHGAFDLYSLGPDLIDNQGAGDDVTATGVNDGYHWKKNRPAGRRMLALSLGAGALCLLLGRYLRWPLVLPIAGIITGLLAVRGCILLLHPGITPYNAPLEGSILLLGIFLLVCVFFLFRALRKPTVSTDSLPDFLSEAQIREILTPLEPDQRLQVVRYRSPASPGRRRCQEMTVSELQELILHSVTTKQLSGGNLAVQLPHLDCALIGNPCGLYWLGENA